MKTVSLYFLLVGVPFLGLVGILRAGERIVPPHSIGGIWSVEIRYSPQTAVPCADLDFAGGDAQMTISQSGTRAEVSFADRGETRLSLVLAGDSLRADGTTEAPGCPAAPLVLDGRLQPETGRRRMEGILTRPDCADCPMATFVAERR